MKKEIKEETKEETPRSLPMVRINTRIRPAQQKYIKSVAKKTKLTEGEIFRELIDIARDSNTNRFNK